MVSYFNTNKLHISHHVFAMILTINTDYFPNTIIHLFLL
jgi:hypothetical protein